jgi:hypothetical protein
VSWAIDDERIGSDGTFFMVLACRRHCVPGTWAATPQACGLCPGQAAERGGVAPAAQTLDARLAHLEAERRARVAIHDALGLPVPGALRTPSYHLGVSDSALPLEAVVAAVRCRHVRARHPPEVLVRAGMLALGITPPDWDQ